MGSAISKGADGLGSLIGNAVSAPFKTILAAGSCEDICSGSWDVPCFINHFCISNLLKLFIILALCYIFLLFIYLLFKVGICQCIGRSLCNMCCVTCQVCWFAFENIITNLWHRLINTKRVYRGRRRRRRCFRDVELGYISTDDGSNASCDYSQVGRKRKSLREITRNDHNRFARQRGRSWIMRRSSRKVQFSKACRNRHGKTRIFKRHRIK